MAMSAGQSSPEKHGTHLDVSEGAAEYAEVGRLLLVHIGDVLLQGLETLLQVGPSGGVGVGGRGIRGGGMYVRTESSHLPVLLHNLSQT